MPPMTSPRFNIGALELEGVNELESGFLAGDVAQYFDEGITLRPGDTVVDVGANVGAFSASVFDQLGGDVRLLLFEPMPVTFEVLARNVAAHFGDAARAFAYGLGEAEGEVEFSFFPGMTALSSSHRPAEELEDERARLTKQVHAMIEVGRAFPLLRVLPADFLDAIVDGHVAAALQMKRHRARIRRLSDVLDEEGIDAIDLLKVDVEGGELDVLAGIADEHWPRIRQIVMEVDHYATRIDVARSTLEARGFDVVARQDTVAEASNNGLVFARRAGSNP